MLILGQYLPGTSMIHRLDPRVKIGSMVALSAMILHSDLVPLAMLGAFLAFLSLASGVSLRHIGKALKPIRIFLLLFFLLHLLFTPGVPILPFHLGSLYITYQGLCKGAKVGFRFLLLVLSGALLTMTTSPTELVMGIERLIRPFRRLRVPSHDVAVMISLALRFVPSMVEEARRIKEAQVARGSRLDTGTATQRVRAMGRLVTPLIHGAFRRADELAVSMEARGFRRGPRTYMSALRLSKADYLAAGAMILLWVFDWVEF